MDPFIQPQSNIYGSCSGNSDGNNTIGNTHWRPGTANFSVGAHRSALSAGDGEIGPYRLIPYARNIRFTGRKDLIELVKRFAGQMGHNRIGLHGLGGSGKSQLALEYVHQRASENNCHVFWLQGSGVLTFTEGFRAVGRLVQINLAGAETDEAGYLLSVRRWFEGPNSGDWILVIDNADNEADFVADDSPLAKFIPQGLKGTVIFTTRSRQVASRQDCRMIEVGKVGEEEAEELFSKRFGSWDSLEEEEKKATTTILGLVHHLPLAVVGAAAFMVETETPPSVYLSILQENEEQMKKLLSQEFYDIQRESDMTKSILGTYFVTFDRISQQLPPAAELLHLMASFDRQNIPEELLIQSGLEGMGDSVVFRGAIGKLLGFSLVTKVKRENRAFYELHRLVQLSLQVYLPSEYLGLWRTAALLLISRLFPRDSAGRRLIGPAYIPHALSVTKDLTGPVVEELCYRMGQYFLEMGFYDNAEVQARRCIALREEGYEHGWNHKSNQRLMLLGMVNSYQGKYEEAEKMGRRALEGYEKVLGPDHPHTLKCVSNLARVLRKQGKYAESEKINRRALDGREKVLGRNHHSTLTSVHTLATVLLAQGKYDEAEEMNRSALDSLEEVLEPDHSRTLKSAHNRAVVLQEQGKYDESGKVFQSVLVEREKVFGPDHPNTLACVNNLACVLWDQGKYAESEKMNRRALMGYEKVLGPVHPNTLASLNNLAHVLWNRGMYDQAENLNRRALEGYDKVLGIDHPYTLKCVSNLACVLQKLGKYTESEKMNQRALEGREKVLGPDHPHTLTSVNNLAVVQSGKKYNGSEMTTRPAGMEFAAKPDWARHDFSADLSCDF